MLDQLVESKNEVQGSSIRNGLLLFTMVSVFLGFFGALGYSLFAQNLGVGGEGLELSTLVAPPIPEEAPEPEPEEEPEPEKKQVEKAANVDTRKVIIQNMNESPKAPEKISTAKLNVKPRRSDVVTIQSDRDADSADRDRPPPTRAQVQDANRGLGQNETTAPKATPKPVEKKAPPPPPPPPPKPKVPKRISKGVVNGSAISLPQPSVPAAARAVNAKGNVSVRIVISKTGRVISASAVSGHPLLRRAAAAAARRAKFRPTLLSGQPVEVAGVIVYRFN